MTDNVEKVAKRVRGAAPSRAASEERKRSLSIPTSDQIKYLPSPSSVKIDTLLNGIKAPDPLSHALLFFSHGDSIPEYDGAQRDKLDATLLEFSKDLDVYKLRALKYQVNLLSSVTDYASFDAICSSLPDSISQVLFTKLYDALRSGLEPIFSVENAVNVVDLWQTKVLEFIALPRIHHVAVSLKTLNLDEVINDVGSLFTQSLFKKDFLNVIESDKEDFDSFISPAGDSASFEDRTPMPFNCICSPSGSGKSTFAMHMCCEKTLAVYLLFTRANIYSVDSTLSQRNYEPFMGISELFVYFLDQDSEILGRSEDFKRAMLDSKYSIIGFIVALIKELDRLRSLPENQGKFWLEMEAKLPDIQFTDMDGAEAFGVIRDIQSKYSNTPLTFFVDETKLSRENVSERELDMVRLLTIRGVLRCLGIAAVFLGTDMQVSNFFKEEGLYSGITPTNQVMSNIYNFSPRFDSIRLGELEDRVKTVHRNHPHILAFVNFIHASREFANPWLIRLALEYMESHPYTNADSFFDDLFCSLFTSFGKRKYFSKEFLKGQVRYMLFYAWSRLAGTFDESETPSIPEICLNGHFGHLCGDPRYVTSKPYFSLFLNENNSRCFVDLVNNQSGEDLIFEPKVVYFPFEKAPLTGLTTFGIGPKHCPLRFLGANLQIFSALRELNVGRSGGSTPDGSILEKIAYFSSIYASRVNGVRGSTFPEFLQRFVKSLMPTKDLAERTELSFDINQSWVQYKIPFISPMGLCSWNKDLIVFLKTVYGNNIHLGIMSPSLGQDPVDCVIHSVNTNGIGESATTTVSISSDHREYIQLDTIPTCSASKDVALCIECKQLKKPLHNAEIKNVLDSKFKKPQFDNCQIFILLALRFNENINPKHEDFRIWRLKKVLPPPAVEGDESVPPPDIIYVKRNQVQSFELAEFPNLSEKVKRQVILIDMETIYGGDLAKVAKLSDIYF